MDTPTRHSQHLRLGDVAEERAEIVLESEHQGVRCEVMSPNNTKSHQQDHLDRI